MMLDAGRRARALRSFQALCGSLRNGGSLAHRTTHGVAVWGAVGVIEPLGVLASVPPTGKGRFAFELDLEGGLLPEAGTTLGGGGISVLSTRVVFFLGLGAVNC